MERRKDGRTDETGETGETVVETTGRRAIGRRATRSGKKEARQTDKPTSAAEVEDGRLVEVGKGSKPLVYEPSPRVPRSRPCISHEVCA
jgi:hypothetical protein